MHIFTKILLIAALINYIYCSKKYEIPLIKDNIIKVDGEILEWNTFGKPIILNEKSLVTRGSWDGVNDLSAEIYVAMDSKNLYLAAKVRDNVPAHNLSTNDSIYNGDCIELYIGEKTPDKPKKFYTPTDYQIGFKAGSDVQVWSWSNISEVLARGEVKNARLVVKKWQDNKGYNLEASVPLENLIYVVPIDSKEYLFDVAIDDADEGKLRKSQLTWNGDGEGWQMTTVWGSAILKKVDDFQFFNIYTPLKKNLTPKGEKVKIYAVSNFSSIEGVQISVDNKNYYTNKESYAEVLLKGSGRTKITGKHKDQTVTKEVVLVLKKEPLPIKINQVGYLPTSKKIVLVDKEATEFEVIDVKTSKVVFKGKLENKGIDRSSKDNIWEGDFSQLTTPGRYKIFIPSLNEESYEFVIAENIYNEVFYKVMRSYYLQRCGIEIDDKITGFKKGPCHNRPAEFHPSLNKKGTLEVNGGWHDAGDYGKYLPSAAVTVGQFLLLYEIMPEKFKDKELDIPESGNGIPDLLDEVRYELEWMLKMQDKDGVVYHKATTKEFPSLWTPPEKDNDTIYIIGVMSHNVGVFAANMAQAARIYKKYDVQFANKCLEAAKKAWSWLEKNGFVGFKNPSDINTGEYPVGQDESARFWAAAELYLTTGEQKYYDYVKLNYTKQFSGRGPITNISWDMVHPIAYYSLYFNSKTEPPLKEFIKTQIIQTADGILRLINIKDNFYRTGLLEFTYTSNKRVLASGVTLLMAYIITKDNKYLDACLEQLNYVFGKNPLTKSYVTGLGSDYPQNVHNRLTLSKGIVFPGLLVQGPNSDTLGPKGYFDVPDSWLTNENAIDFSAPLVVLSAYFKK
ncbi:MAG: glycoside hydrolase family 9 protein [Endomicrobiia bacterium]